jgi:hypothetical protein
LEDVGKFYGHLVYFTAILVYFVAIWYSLWFFGLFFPVLVCCTRQNLATLPLIAFSDHGGGNSKS